MLVDICRGPLLLDEESADSKDMSLVDPNILRDEVRGGGFASDGESKSTEALEIVSCDARATSPDARESDCWESEDH